MDEDDYLIWSNEHRAWWAAGSNGYVKKLGAAGLYSRDKALALCRSAIMTAAHIGIISEIPVRKADMEEFLKWQPLPEQI